MQWALELGDPGVTRALTARGNAHVDVGPERGGHGHFGEERLFRAPSAREWHVHVLPVHDYSLPGSTDRMINCTALRRAAGKDGQAVINSPKTGSAG
jgi:hypothetical protein